MNRNMWHVKLLASVFVCAFGLLAFAPSGAQQEAASFSFEAIRSLDEMTAFIRDHLRLGSSRSDVRRAFVTQGHATLKVHRSEPGVEKYIYDVDLCHYYIWRWNISADFDPDGRMLQAYVNGNPAFADGKPKRVVSKVAEEGKKASIYRVQRPRPEAFKGESSLGFILFDRDSDLTTTSDQAAAGAGPSRPDPVDMGRMVTYVDVDPWRSIFDSDAAERIAPYSGDCAAADARYELEKQRARSASAPR